MTHVRATLLSLVFAVVAAFSLSTGLDAQERPYTEGSVWDVTLVKTKPGQYESYLADLSRVWRKFNDEATKRGS